MKEIKWAWQRIVRGYDDRIYWDFEEYLLHVMPALKEFCLKQLKNKEHMHLNPERYEVFEKTVELINNYEKMPREHFYKVRNEINELLEYVGSKSGFYWD